jgi:hypothetical protein
MVIASENGKMPFIRERKILYNGPFWIREPKRALWASQSKIDGRSGKCGMVSKEEGKSVSIAGVSEH